MAVHGVGIDVADADRIGRLADDHGERFTGRWFSRAEVAEADAGQDRAASLAARFAAKEAVWKALGLSGAGAVPWAQISVHDLETGPRPRVALSGDLAAAAARRGVAAITVSCSSSGRVVTAVAIAETATG